MASNFTVQGIDEYGFEWGTVDTTAAELEAIRCYGSVAAQKFFEDWAAHPPRKRSLWDRWLGRG